MGVSLTDSTGRSLKASAWTWGVVHYVVSYAKPPIFDDDDLCALRPGYIELDEQQIRKLHDFLNDVIRPMIPPDHRMMYGFSVTSEPDDYTFHRDDPAKNYSLHHTMLVHIINLLAAARAPVTIC